MDNTNTNQSVPATTPQQPIQGGNPDISRNSSNNTWLYAFVMLFIFFIIAIPVYVLLFRSTQLNKPSPTKQFPAPFITPAPTATIIRGETDLNNLLNELTSSLDPQALEGIQSQFDLTITKLSQPQ